MVEHPKRVLVAGATGYLGSFLVAEYKRRGCVVVALVRDATSERARALPADHLVEAQATVPTTLRGCMEGIDLVVSSLGITRQRDGLSYRDVDYQANVNLLEEALRAGVQRFAYVHVLGASQMAHVPLVAAKQAFVERLQQAPVASTVVAPSGYFSDMGDFLEMARSGRVWLFGDGGNRLNPIHGADLAVAIADATEAGQAWLDVGGPDVYTQAELAELALDCAGQPRRITHLPDSFRRGALRILPVLTPRSVHGPAAFFLTAMGLDLVGEPVGDHHLAEHFKGVVQTSA